MNYNAVRAAYDAMRGDMGGSSGGGGVTNGASGGGGGRGGNGSSEATPESLGIVESSMEWLGEWKAQTGSDTKDTTLYKLVFGEKIPMTPEEEKALRGTHFDRGYMLYRYEGQMKKSRSDARPENKDARYWVREGQGVLKYPTGDIYDGNWRFGKRHGSGTLSLVTGYMYQGEWKDDKIQGSGRETFGRKWAVIGQYENELPSGKGQIWYAPTDHRKHRYEGEFQNGLRHGKGVVYYDNGDVFEGTWSHGKRDGVGKTTYPNGRQYESTWQDDKLIGSLRCIEKKLRKPAPKSATKYEKLVCLQPADLTKWKVQDDCRELPLEHFHRLRLGFNLLDSNGSGELSMNELKLLWPTSDREMLFKLDKDKSGTVDFMEVLLGWYPNVPQQDMARFLYKYIPPHHLHKVRGILAGFRHENNHIYSTQCGGHSLPWTAASTTPCQECGLEAEHHRRVTTAKKLPNAGFMGICGHYSEPDFVVTVTVSQLEAANPPYKVGGEKVSASMFTQAASSHDPPRFIDLLEVIYPNIPYTMFQYYEMSSLPQAELDTIRGQFRSLSNNGKLVISEFEEAVEKYRNSLVKKEYRVSNELVYSLLKPGLFNSWPMWNIGGVSICVEMLDEISEIAGTEGKVEWKEFLRFNFPNVPCLKTRARLGEDLKSDVVQSCKCDICIAEEA
eukprot:PhF_6_TR16985/c0_g1_i1/m.25688